MKWLTEGINNLGVWIQTSQKCIQLLIDRIEKQQFLKDWSLCQVCFGPYRWGWVRERAALCGSQWFKSPSSPPKTISTIFSHFVSAGITLSASQMSKGECGSHQWRALSFAHTLDTHSARVNKPQPSLICFIFHKERKSRNLITKRIFWGLNVLKFQDC